MTDVKAEINEAEPVVEKSAKQLEKEAKKAAKLAKFNEKKSKEAAQKPAAPKEKTEVRFKQFLVICKKHPRNQKKKFYPHSKFNRKKQNQQNKT